uniref:McKusick-Kaufman syndrome n=1 Tax=Timema douglasi TaxID=61478 RepID=A0A7R8VBE4_TIMDO|nr:unnamed protein product [Timema douglasi]
MCGLTVYEVEPLGVCLVKAFLGSIGEEMGEVIIISGVKIIACQKVVHPMLRMHLRRKGVLLLDRLGTAPAQAVQKLSGAVPISSLTRYVENLDMMLGRITSVRRLICDGKEYLHLQRKGGNVTTLFVNAMGEEATIELKVCVEQSLSLLYQLVSQPVVTPGAGCFDMFLAASLEQVIQEESISVCSSSELRHVVRCIQQSLLMASGLDTSPTSLIAVDSTFKHAWSSLDTSCCCGLIPQTLVKEQEGKWFTLDWACQQEMFPHCSWFRPTSADVIKDLHECAIVDLYSSKVNAVIMALESSVNLLGIGMIISRV